MVKHYILFAIIFISTTMACSQNLGPGYEFDLFKNTPNWELAQAVQNEDSIKIKRLIKEKTLDINFQEKKFGVTLLQLAVANDKLISTKVLLEEKANLNIKDYRNNKPIHEATKFISLKKNAFKILSLLIKFNANVNDTLINIKENDTTNFYVPLMGACQDFNCAKLLIDNGADIYIKFRDTYPIWSSIFVDDLHENIYFAKYLIVDKNFKIPNPIVYSIPNNKPLDIYYYLKKENFRGDKRKEDVKQTIENYLKNINFPEKGTYEYLHK